MADCRDCHWASRGPDAAPFDWMCHAPEVIALLEMDNECTPCRYAREFRNVCGAHAAHFRRREGAINGCLGQARGANSRDRMSARLVQG